MQKNKALSDYPPLNLPASDLPLRHSAVSGRPAEVFDGLRQCWVALTPEEWVRQHFTAFLMSHRGFPSALMANEVALRLNGTLRRCDTIVYTKTLKPLCIIEYKAPTVELGQKVFDQIARYNMVLAAPYLMVSNGLRHFCMQCDDTGRFSFMSDIPFYSQMTGRAEQ